jgi:hypothetical protein
MSASYDRVEHLRLLKEWRQAAAAYEKVVPKIGEGDTAQPWPASIAALQDRVDETWKEYYAYEIAHLRRGQVGEG